jgi:sugar O-acyltransferase (sialic acid O-acetyltransferase NeuD family)
MEGLGGRPARPGEAKKLRMANTKAFASTLVDALSGLRLSPLVVYGAGGLGREIAWLAGTCSRRDGQAVETVCFADDAHEWIGQDTNGLPVMSLEAARQLFPAATVMVAVGSPQAREAMAHRARRAGFGFETLIHPTVVRSPWVEVGPGTVICARSSLTTNITIGEQVVVNPHCTIGHDVRVDSYTVLAPGVHISGFVHIGKRVFVGAGAVVSNGTSEAPLVIGDDAVVGAGAVVVGPVHAGATVVGVPARPISRK